MSCTVMNAPGSTTTTLRRQWFASALIADVLPVPGGPWNMRFQLYGFPRRA